MNLFSSITKYKCPRCRKGDIFLPMKSISDMLKMPKHCAVCGQATEPEPGFYYGAMFMSYIVTGFLYLGIIALLIMGFDFSVNKAFLVLLIFVTLTFVPTARLARSVWLHMMVKYDAKF
jgi:uncharacterized protein (DUF983 family)